ncbi:MAG: DUF2283 domain-containing protein [Methanophagales archaeon ANME-1-THS]|nr:MAG: DUF2283 domain-containing protein [Methanophagales archaeon ANME-1-THS]
MKISYDRDVDILMIQVGDEKIEYAEEMDGIIIHFTKDDRPILIEILDASDFITSLNKVAISSKKPEMVEIL